MDPAVPWGPLATALGVFTLNLLSPGPNVFNTIGLALGSGRRAGLAAAAAVGPGVLMWSLAAVLGAAALFAAVPMAESALSLAGGALLIAFGLRYLGRARRPLEDLRARRGASAAQAFLATLAILATNPKALTTWLMILSIYPVAETGVAGRAALVLGAVACACSVHLGYALLFSTRAAAAVYGRWARWVEAGVGLFFLALGANLVRREL